MRKIWKVTLKLNISYFAKRATLKMVKISSCLFFGMTLEARKLFQSLLEACLWELDSIHINPYCNSLSSWLRPDALHNKGSLPNKSVLLLDIDPAPPLHAPSLSTPIPHSPQWTTRLQKSLFIFKNLLQGFKFHDFFLFLAEFWIQFYPSKFQFLV